MLGARTDYIGPSCSGLALVGLPLLLVRSPRWHLALSCGGLSVHNCSGSLTVGALASCAVRTFHSATTISVSTPQPRLRSSCPLSRPRTVYNPYISLRSDHSSPRPALPAAIRTPQATLRTPLPASPLPFCRDRPRIVSMEFIKRIAGVSTPPAPKFKPLDLPTLGEGGVPTPPPLIEGWASSDSSGSSVSSSTPTTPSTSPTPWRRQHTPYSSPLASYRVPSVRSPTPQTEMRSEAWHVMTSQMEKTISRQTLTPSPEILKPRPRRASPLHEPSPVQVMQGLVSPSPRPIHGKPIKSILKHCMYFCIR